MFILLHPMTTERTLPDQCGGYELKRFMIFSGIIVKTIKLTTRTIYVFFWTVSLTEMLLFENILKSFLYDSSHMKPSDFSTNLLTVAVFPDLLVFIDTFIDQ